MHAFHQISAADIQDHVGQAEADLPGRGMYAGLYSDGE
jgi:hypothetical protein